MRVVQLSDMHLSADPDGRRNGVLPWQRLRWALDDIASASVQPDLIVLTGDVAHDHSEETYIKLRDFLEPTGYSYRVLPGNHDSPELMPVVFGERGGRFVWREANWLLLGANSHLPGEIAGALAEDEQAWIKEQLGSCADAHKAIFLHHPPVSVGNIFFDAVGLRDAEAIRNQWRSIAGLRFVSFGHIHRPFEYQDGTVDYWAAPSTTHGYVGAEALDVAPDLFGYRIFDLGEEGYETSLRLLEAR